MTLRTLVKDLFDERGFRNKVPVENPLGRESLKVGSPTLYALEPK